MPKVYLTTESKKQDEIKKLINIYLVENGMSIADLSKKSNISTNTLYRKLKHPGGWNIAELGIIFKVLKIPEEKFMLFYLCK